MHPKSSPSGLNRLRCNLDLLADLYYKSSPSLSENSAVDESNQFLLWGLQFLGVVPAKFPSYSCLDAYDLSLNCNSEKLFKSCSSFFLQEHLGEADLVFGLQLGLGFTEQLHDSDGCLTILIIVLGVSLKTGSIPTDELIEVNSNGVACFSNSDRFKHTCTSQLLTDVEAIKDSRRELTVGLDATDIPWARLFECNY